MDCNTKVGNPKKGFWDYYGIDFEGGDGALERGPQEVFYDALNKWRIA